MNTPLKAVLIAIAAAAVTAVVCTVLIRPLRSEPEWKASGDGRTIFNTRTGDMRYTATGRSVAEVQTERERETQEKHKFELRIRALAYKHNSDMFRNVKRFVDANPDVKGVGYSNEWEGLTRPFRTNKLLTPQQHEHMLDFLGRAVKKEPYKSDPSFFQAIEDLKEGDAFLYL